MSVLSCSLKQYFIQKGDEKCKNITLSIPYSLRQPPEDDKVFDLNPHIKNDFAVLLFDLPLVNDLKTGMPILAKQMNKYKNSIEPVVQFYAVQILTALLPMYIMGIIARAIADKSSIVFSNVPGNREPLHMCGGVASKMFFFVPSLGNIGMGVSVMTSTNCLKLCLNADTGFCEDPQLLMKLLESNFE